MTPLSTCLALCLIVATAWTSRPGVGPAEPTGGRLFFLDIRGGRVVSASPDGSDVAVLATGRTGIPDGIAIDVQAGHIFWTGMGQANADDGYIDRSDLNGGGIVRVVPPGGAFTPKQLKLDAAHGKLYWADREGMRVMRSNLDGSAIETLVETGRGDDARRNAANWCVGIALDVERGHVYWTQKGGNNAGVGSIRRTNLERRPGEDPASRSDIEVLFEGLPEPIDLDLDLSRRVIYWTDRGDPPKGNSVSRAPMDPPAGTPVRSRTDQQVLVGGLQEAIGLALDVPHDRMFFTDLAGNVYRSRLDGSGKTTLLSGQGSLTGIAYAELSTRK